MQATRYGRRSPQTVLLQGAFCAIFAMGCTESSSSAALESVQAKTLADASLDEPDGTTVPSAVRYLDAETGGDASLDEPDGKTAPLAEGCLEGFAHSLPIKSYERKTWDAASRVLTSKSGSAPDTMYTSWWRYGPDGRILADLYSEYSYDQHDNVSDVRSTNKPIPTPAGWVPSGYTYVNEYGSNGHLVSSAGSSYGPSDSSPPPAVRRVYTEDAAGRCTRIETTLPSGTKIEERQYDAAGRLTLSKISAEGSLRVRAIGYDDMGRVVSSNTVVSGAQENHQGSITISHTYLPDGSERVDTCDETDDSGPDCYRVRTRTAACLLIDAEIGTRPDARCRVE